MRIDPTAKIFIIVGMVLLIVGILWQFGIIIQALRLGRLPGDILIEGKNGRFYFPVMTCIVVSVVLSAISWLFKK